MPWVGTIPDTNGLYHFYPPATKVRKIKVCEKELRGVIRQNGESIIVKWVDKDDSADKIKSKNSVVAAKLTTEARNDVFFARVKVYKMKTQKIQNTVEIDAACDKVKEKIMRYGEMNAEKARVSKEYEDSI